MTVTTRLSTLAVAALLAGCARYATTASPSAAMIAGTLRDTSGAALDEASVRLRAPGSTKDLQCTLTDAAGRYVFRGLAPGSYDLFLVVPAATALEGPNPHPVTVAAKGATDVDLIVTLLPVSFSRHVAPVLRGACTGCHSAAGGAPLGLKLTGRAARALTVGVPSVEHPGMKRIRATKPDSSYLLYKLEGTHLAVGGSGLQMPQGFPRLPDQTIRMIGRWVAEGALPN
ncbi:MAG TPA: carboxypeptidase-like regulatory domain-containing protein [Gemmatimonadales bacterium]|nr:carboxypeptidase-like regulatory domain-containing protein [Gemmatimonadales bacterium]